MLTPVPGATPRYDDDGHEIVNVVTCGHCGRSWNDAAISHCTPVPSGRCPFEYEHEYEEDEDIKTFTVKIDCGNAAFDPDPSPELARILRGIAERIERGDDYTMFQTILDANGNDVGRFAIKPADYR
jgi:hypothetical protein